MHHIQKARSACRPLFVDGLQTLHSPSAITKPSLRALCRLSCARSVLICFTSLLRFPHAVMSHVMAVLSTGSTLISNLMDEKVDTSTAKRPVLNAAPSCVAVP